METSQNSITNIYMITKGSITNLLEPDSLQKLYSNITSNLGVGMLVLMLIFFQVIRFLRVFKSYRVERLVRMSIVGITLIAFASTYTGTGFEINNYLFHFLWIALVADFILSLLALM